MHEEKKLELRLAQIEARVEAHDELLGVVLRDLISGTSASGLRATLEHAARYEGPSRTHMAMARLAATALGKK